MRSVGIDIGRFSVKIAEVEALNRSFTLTRLEEFPLSTDPTKDNEIEILDLLRNLAQQFDSANTTFVFGLPQEQVVVRSKDFPFRERHKILKSVPFELEDDIPFSGEGALFDAKVTRYRGNGAEVIAVATPVERVHALLQVARDGGIEPTIVSTEGLALANLFEEWTEPPPEGPPLVLDKDKEHPAAPINPAGAQLILNLGHRSTLMIVRSEDRLLTTRTLDWGGLDVARALAAKYNLHIVEALKELRKKAFILTSNEGATRDQVIFSDTIKHVVDEFVHELQLALLEIEADFQVKVEKALMTGGACQIQNLGPYLTQHLEVPFNRLKQIPSHASLNFESGNSGEVSKAIAIALAIEGLKRPRNPATNLLRGELAKQSQTLKRFLQKWGHAMAVGSAAFLCLFLWSILRDSFAEDMANQAYEQMKIQAKNVTNGELKGARANPSSVRKYIRDQEQEAKNRKLAEKVQTISSAMDVFKRLTESTPAKKNVILDVQKFVVDNERVEVQGLVGQGADIETIANAWKSLSADNKIERFTPTLSVPAGKTAFGLRLKVNRIKGK